MVSSETVSTEAILHKGRADGDKERVRPTTQLIERGVDVSAHVDHLLDDDLDLQSLLPENPLRLKSYSRRHTKCTR